MPDSNNEARRAFVWSSRAWYRSVAPENEIVFGMYYPDGGTDGEMSMRWYDLGGSEVPRLEVYDDSWAVLASFSDLLATLATWDDENIDQELFVKILLEHGFVDDTKYDSPYEPEEEKLRKSLLVAQELVSNLKQQIAALESDED